MAETELKVCPRCGSEILAETDREEETCGKCGSPYVVKKPAAKKKPVRRNAQGKKPSRKKA